MKHPTAREACIKILIQRYGEAAFLASLHTEQSDFNGKTVAQLLQFEADTLLASLNGKKPARPRDEIDDLIDDLRAGAFEESFL